MELGLDIKKLRDAVRARRVEWRVHVLSRMTERSIRRAHVIDVLLRGERIEDYPDDKPFPSALFHGWVSTRPIHVVAALDATTELAFIITAYEPDREHFEDDYKTRRSQS